jgi:hypothetical protein
MKKSKRGSEDLSGMAREAKALVALAFRNGPIEDVHAGKNARRATAKQNILISLKPRCGGS